MILLEYSCVCTYKLLYPSCFSSYVMKLSHTYNYTVIWCKNSNILTKLHEQLLLFSVFKRFAQLDSTVDSDKTVRLSKDAILELPELNVS